MAEDAALKTRLSQMEVSTGRRVQVFYRHPEKDTEKVYPFATIELLDINHATDRQHSEQQYYVASEVGLNPAQQAQYSTVDYYPDLMTKADLETAVVDGGFLTTESFVPVNLLYQVTTYTRSARDDRALTALMLRRVTPFRRGFIEVPEDGTIRRLDLLNWNGTDILDGEAGYKKRIFRKVYTLSMSAEIPASDLIGLKRVASVEGTISDNYDPASDVLSSSFSEEF
jgi:hypothetical protein